MFLFVFVIKKFTTFHERDPDGRVSVEGDDAGLGLGSGVHQGKDSFGSHSEIGKLANFTNLGKA